MKARLIIPFVIGFLGFYLVIGIAPLSFQNIGWLSKGDLLFNYLGWEIFRYGPWTNPIGLNPNYGLEFSSSIVYSDSVPILAIFFKIFSKWLGESFQYFGLWLLICFVLQAYFGFRLAELITKNIWLKIFISIIFLFSPVMLFRANVHLALVGHFVLLWGIYLNFKKKYDIGSWAFLMFIVLGIHFYLFIMVFALWFGNILDGRISKKEIDIKSFIFNAAFILFVVFLSAWQYGYFAIALGESAANGYGGDRINLLAFLNPFGWSLLNKHNLFEPPTIEGFAYIGAGVIGALFFGAIALFQQNVRVKFIRNSFHHKFLLILIFGLSIISVTHNIDIGNTHYFLTLNERLFNILSVVRSSGRMIWPLVYLIIYALLWLIINGYHKKKILILGILCLLQVVDTSKGWKRIHKYFDELNGPSIQRPLKDNFWKEIPKKYSVIKIITPYWGIWNTVGLYAAQNKMSTNAVYLARVDKNKLEQSMKKTNYEVASGQFDPQAIYMFQKWSSDINLVVPKFNSGRDLYATIDGITVLAPNYKLCKECKSIAPTLEITSIIPTLNIGELIKFSKNGNGGEFLIDGWLHSEPWGVWSLGATSLMAIPMGANAPSKIQLNFRALVGPRHQFSDIKIFINGEYQKEIRITAQLNNHLELLIPKHFRSDKFILIKFEYLNPSSPKNSGYGNEDDRILTLGLESMKLLK